MPEFTICASLDAPGERELLNSWLDRWRGRLLALSENRGCGCCVDIFEVTGPEEAMKELPVEMLAARAGSIHHGA